MILFLIGFRATGKTTIGRHLAQRLGCHWIDSDAEIEKFSQRDIPTIFREDGEQGFRTIEQNVIKVLVDRTRRNETLVMSLGGGAVLAAATRKLLMQRGKTVWLTANTECLIGRIESAQADVLRPALTELPLPAEVSRLLKEREPVYSECADYNINTAKLDLEEAVEQIASWWLTVDTNKSGS